MALVQLVAPIAEPIALADVKNHLRIDSDITSDDAMLNLYITAARKHGETLTGRSFVTQQWRLRLDGFAQRSDDLLGAGGGYNVIRLERGKVQSVDSVNYLDMQGTPQIVDPTTIATDLDSFPARVSPAFGKIWPVPLPQIGCVWIDYTAGYGLAVAVPGVIQQWMLVRVATLYEHRAAVEVVARGKLEALPYVDCMLDSETVVSI